jgi:hypothetical protein
VDGPGARPPTELDRSSFERAMRRPGSLLALVRHDRPILGIFGKQSHDVLPFFRGPDKYRKLT